MNIAEKITRAKADIDAVYEGGKAKAFSEVEPINSELEQILYGKDTGGRGFYDAFWDAFKNGTGNIQLNYCFAGRGWNDVTFFPKYDLKPNYSVIGMFMWNGVTNLEKRLQECGVTLDTSNNANYGGIFSYSKTVSVPEITFSSFASSMNRVFADATSLHTIRKIILQDGFNMDFLTAFENCKALENVVFEGVIPKSIKMAQSTKLSKASITNIIEHLSTTASGQTATFSKTAVATAFGSAESAEWNALISTKSNWTISLV